MRQRLSMCQVTERWRASLGTWWHGADPGDPVCLGRVTSLSVYIQTVKLEPSLSNRNFGGAHVSLNAYATGILLSRGQCTTSADYDLDHVTQTLLLPVTFSNGGSQI